MPDEKCETSGWTRAQGMTVRHAVPQIAATTAMAMTLCQCACVIPGMAIIASTVTAAVR